MGFLLVGGVLRSICFTGVNAMVFSDIDDADSGQATAINAVAQQVSLATGVALAGGVLDIAGRLHGGGFSSATSTSPSSWWRPLPRSRWSSSPVCHPTPVPPSPAIAGRPRGPTSAAPGASSSGRRTTLSCSLGSVRAITTRAGLRPERLAGRCGTPAGM